LFVCVGEAGLLLGGQLLGLLDRLFQQLVGVHAGRNAAQVGRQAGRRLLLLVADGDAWRWRGGRGHRERLLRLLLARRGARTRGGRGGGRTRGRGRLGGRVGCGQGGEGGRRLEELGAGGQDGGLRAGGGLLLVWAQDGGRGARTADGGGRDRGPNDQREQAHSCRAERQRPLHFG